MIYCVSLCMFYSDSPCFTMIQCDSSCFTLIYHDLLSFTMFHCDSPWLTVFHCDSPFHHVSVMRTPGTAPSRQSTAWPATHHCHSPAPSVMLPPATPAPTPTPSTTTSRRSLTRERTSRWNPCPSLPPRARSAPSPAREVRLAHQGQPTASTTTKTWWGCTSSSPSPRRVTATRWSSHSGKGRGHGSRATCVFTAAKPSSSPATSRSTCGPTRGRSHTSATAARRPSLTPPAPLATGASTPGRSRSGVRSAPHPLRSRAISPSTCECTRGRGPGSAPCATGRSLMHQASLGTDGSTRRWKRSSRKLPSRFLWRAGLESGPALSSARCEQQQKNV